MDDRVDRDWIDRSTARIILRGLQAGYPSCCVYQFAADSYVEEAAEYMTLDEEIGRSLILGSQPVECDGYRGRTGSPGTSALSPVTASI
jgi:hypothetical protein